MSVCTCPHGHIIRDCQYHRELAVRALEVINNPNAWPEAHDALRTTLPRTHTPGGYIRTTPQEKP